MSAAGDPVHGGSPCSLRVVREEGRPDVKCSRLIEAEIIVQKVEQLLFHEIDLRSRKDDGVGRPVLVLRRRVVEVLGADDERSEEDAMLCRPVPLCINCQKRRERRIYAHAPGETGSLPLNRSR